MIVFFNFSTLSLNLFLSLEVTMMSINLLHSIVYMYTMFVIPSYRKMNRLMHNIDKFIDCSLLEILILSSH